MQGRIGCSVLAAAAVVVSAGCIGDVVEDDGAGAALAVSADAIQLVRRGSGKCLDVYAAGTADGTKIHQWGCNGTVAQAFRLEELGGGVHRLVNPSSGKCVDVDGAGTSNGTKVQLWRCNGSGAQSFRVDSVGGGYARLVNPHSGKCLDVQGASSADGARVQIWSCHSGDAQRWRLEERAGGGDPPSPPPDDGLVWRTANLTHFTSYPDPGSDECVHYNGCMWAGYFAFVDGKKPESWVMSHNIVAVHSRDAGQYALKTLRLRKGGATIDATVYDMCSDSDCSGCCTRNSSETGFLIDVEKYTMQRFGHGSGIVEWACLDCD